MTTTDTTGAIDINDVKRAKRPAGKDPRNPEIIAEMKAFLGNQAMSQAAAAKAMNISGGTLSNYLNDKPEFEWRGSLDIEPRLEDFMRAVLEKKPLRDGLFETDITQKFCSFVRMLRAGNLVGVCVGDPGIGKTCAVKQCVSQDVNSVHLTVTEWSSSRAAFVSMLYAKLGLTEAGKKELAIVRYFAASAGIRVPVIDGAHKLALGAVRFVMDLHDETKTPTVFVGNGGEEGNREGAVGERGIMATLRRERQLFSRVGSLLELKLEGTALADAVRKQLQRTCPEFAREIEPQAMTIARNSGHMRSLEMHLHLMAEFIGRERLSAPEALKRAHLTLLTTGYSLDDAA